MKHLTIGQVAKEAGVNVETVRFYERQGLLNRPDKPQTGFRRYSSEAVAILRFIRRAKELGFSLQEIKELLTLRRHSAASCDDVRRQAEVKLGSIGEKIDALTRMRDALQGLVAACQERGHLGECPILEILGDGQERYAGEEGRVAEAILRLRRLLPLQERQRALPPEGLLVHRAILHAFAAGGRPLTTDDVGKLVVDAPSWLRRLQRQDLLILDAEGDPAGAYPFTMEETLHRLTINGRNLYAMCALDALAVGPMFGIEVQIHSLCRVSGEAICLQQKGMELAPEQPGVEILLGIGWQKPGACAARSICRDMVFLKGQDRARLWQENGPEGAEVFSLPEAIRLASAFFLPLIKD